MARKNKILEKCFRGLVYVAPAMLFFSYYPVISFGANESMNFELSLPLIWLVVFDIVGMTLVIRRKMLRDVWKYWPWMLLPAFLTISVLWSENSVRGILAAGILWLIYIVGFAMWQLRDLFKNLGAKEKFYKIFLGSTLAICAWCWLQSILDLVGVGKEATLMCDGCVTEMFGFPHPNGFAIEPQFMGNLLLAPAIITAYAITNKQNSKKLKREHSRGVVLTTGQADSARYCSTGSSSVPVVKTTTGSCFLGFNFLLFCLFIISATLFLTFSRGAIYACILAMIFMTVWVIVKTRNWKNLLIWPVVILGFLFTLNIQGLFAEIGPTSETYQSGIAKSLNQLSLGVIDVREQEEDNVTIDNEGGSGEYTEMVNGESEQKVQAENEAKFDGYVESSTTTRVSLNDAAIETWVQNPKTVLFGVGLGGAGEAMYRNGKTAHPKEIVQNEYFSLLLESGLVGIGLLVLTIISIVRFVNKLENRLLVYVLMVAYGITLCFFAGLANALQIYLMPMLLLLTMI